MIVMTALIFEVDELARMKWAKTAFYNTSSERFHNARTSNTDKEKTLFTLLIPMQTPQADPK